VLNEQQTRDLLLLYKKHGWNLRRVLLSEESGKCVSETLKNLFGTTEIISFGVDAAWFSRASGADSEAWELRRLGKSPFALVEIFENDDDEEVREEARKEMETRLLESASKIVEPARKSKL
jgi:hypothetical protein